MLIFIDLTQHELSAISSAMSDRRIGLSSNTEYDGSSFREVRDAVFSDPYPAIPEYKITLASFYSGFKNILLADSRRRVSDSSDLVAPFQKLVHPKGIALSGRWRITEKSPWTGCFAEGFEGLIIARCSVLLYETKQGQHRGFAFAGKIFPTLDPDQRVKTGNFVLIDVFTGSKEKYFTNAALTNDPPFGTNVNILRMFGILAAGTAAFMRADIRPFFRPIYPVAEVSVPAGGEVRTPRWMMVRGWPGSGRVDREDFRDELRVENYPDQKLRFDLSAASGCLPSCEKDWRRLGHIELTESVVSHSGDRRIVFRHPALRRGSSGPLNYTL